MHPILFQSIEWLKYWLNAVDEHSLQAPFIFDFYNSVIKKRSSPIANIEVIRKELLKNQTYIKVNDLGAGSRLNKQADRKISYIARTSSSSSKFSLFLRSLIEYMQSGTILELGTSFGMNTAYMAHGLGTQVYTFEGSPAIASVARQNFKKLGLSNIYFKLGNIDNILQESIKDIPNFDLVYMDANHTKEATLRYFNIIQSKLKEKSVVVIDDIHWSQEMREAWKVLIDKTEVTLSVDLYDAGLLFFDPSFTKKHYIISF